MTKTTAWKEYQDGTSRLRIRATYGIDYGFARKHNQAPHFAITGETEVYRNGWREDSGGCLHELIEKHFPHLAPLVKWHLMALGEGPMHYLANGIYWWEHAEAIRTFQDSYEWEKYGSPRAAGLAHFKSTIVFGAIPDEELPSEGKSPQAVREWLQGRLPKLLELFNAAMQDADVLEKS